MGDALGALRLVAPISTAAQHVHHLGVAFHQLDQLLNGHAVLATHVLHLADLRVNTFIFARGNRIFLFLLGHSCALAAAKDAEAEQRRR